MTSGLDQRLLALRDAGGRGGILHHGQNAVLVFEEGLENGSLELAAAGDPQLQRINRLGIMANLVMEVRARGAAGGADIADDLTLVDLGSNGHVLGDAAHMGVKGFITIGMFQLDHIAVGAVAAGKFDDAFAGRLDRRSGRGAEIDAHMHLGIAQERMLAHAETGGQAASRP